MLKRERVKSSAVRSGFANIINRVRFQKAHVVVMHYDEPSVVMLSVEEYERLIGKGSYNIRDNAGSTT